MQRFQVVYHVMSNNSGHLNFLVDTQLLCDCIYRENTSDTKNVHGIPQERLA